MGEKINVNVSKADFDRIEKILAETTAEFIKELPNMVHKRLEGAVAKILGFENGWGEWRVDHCNGRMSIMSDYIGKKARDAARDAANSIEFKVTPELTKAIAKEYADVFKEELRDQIKEKARERVSAELDRAAKAGELTIEAPTFPTKKDVADPSYGSRPLEKLIMATIVANNTPLNEEKE